MAIELRPEDGDPRAAFASAPLAELLKGFLGHAEGALVVCGPQRVRSLLGSSGSPGVLALALAHCANALQHGLLALSAFFALPEVGHSKLPCYDLLDGCRRGSWEQCTIETFTDLHKAFSLLVRCVSGLLEPREATRQCQEYLGRLPLVFCLQSLRPVGAAPGMSRRSLCFVDAPPPVSGGPTPQHFANATARLQAGRCVILHAAVGAAPSGPALQTALGPLQRLAKEAPQEPMSPEVAGLCRSMPLQAEKASQDIWQLCSLLQRCGEEQPLGSVGVPCCDPARLWKSCFGGIRQITLAEVRRQYPLAIQRAQRLRALLLSIRDWQEPEDRASVEEALTLLEPFAGPSPAGEPLLELAALAWQQQWQVRHLVGCIHAAEERDELMGEVEDLAEDLSASQEALASATSRAQSCDQKRQAIEEAHLWQLQQERARCEELSAQLMQSRREVQVLRLRLEHLEELRPRTPDPPDPARPQRKSTEWQMQERIKELEGTVQQLRKEQKADREMLRDVCAHRDRLQQLRKSEERLRQRGSPSAPSALSTQRSIASSSKESSTTCNPTDSPPEAK